MNIKGNKIVDRILGTLLLVSGIGILIKGIWLTILMIGIGGYLILRKTN